MRRLLKLIPVAWLVLLLLVPAGAYVLGARQPLLENREKTALPDLNRGTIRNEATFKQLDAAILERLPLRGDAVELRSRLAVDVFRDSTHADVLIGSGGWLYYRPDLALCEPATRPASDPADAADFVARTLVASGRRVGMIVAGSKMVTHPQNLPAVDDRLLDCTKRTERRVQERLARTPGGIDLQTGLERLEEQGKPTFLRRDTHWNATGREFFLRTVFDRIQPGLANRAGLRRGPDQRIEGDFGPLLGMKRAENDATVVADRTPSTPITPGTVLLIGDSQMGRALLAPLGTPSLFAQVLPGQTACNWSQALSGACDKPLEDSRTVIIETVARELRTFVQTCGRMVAIGGRQLSGEAGRWEQVGGSAAPSRSVTLDGSQTQLRFQSASPSRNDIPRLLKLPVRRLPQVASGEPPATVRLTQDPRSQPPVPCASESASQGEALFLPIPAGQPTSEVTFSLAAPKGTKLGAPELITLDGASQD